jgi:hypothetical protein
VTENSEKQLRTVPFIVHATRGVIRDPVVRRRTMFGLVIAALVLLLAGSTILQPFLDPHERPVLFVLFWVFCAWLALAAMLLALFDFLMVRLEARKEQRMLREKVQGMPVPDVPGETPGDPAPPTKSSQPGE